MRKSNPVHADVLELPTVGSSAATKRHAYGFPRLRWRSSDPQGISGLCSSWTERFSGHDIIGYAPSLAGVPAAIWIEARAQRANVVLRSCEMNDMLAAALGGAGLAVLPCLLGDEEAGLDRPEPLMQMKSPAAKLPAV